MTAPLLVGLRAADVSVVISIPPGQLPAVLHWGADLGPLTPESAQALAASALRPFASNVTDEAFQVALLPEQWTGWGGRPGLSGSRSGCDWSPRFAPVAVRVDETAVDLAGAPVDAGAAVVTVETADEATGLALTLTIELTEAGLLRSRATLLNTGTEAYQLQDLVLAYPVPGHAREVLDFGGRWTKERTPQRGRLDTGQHVREGRHGRTGADSALVLHLGTPGFDFSSGEVWGVHTAWSGNHTHYAERLLTGEQVAGGGELLLPGEVVLAAGESYDSPWLYGSYGRGLDAVARRFHRQLRSRPQHPGTARPVTLNVWEAVYFDHDLDRLLDLAQRAADLGVERFVLDDGWFGSRRDDHSGLGDWVVSEQMWPNGLGPLIERVRELGMEFGLWFEPEMVNPDSDVARAHPEWVMAAAGDRLPPESRFQQVLNLGIPECYAQIRDQMDAVLSENDIAYIKWDHNRDLVDAGTLTDRGRPGVHAQTQAFYRLVDELKERHPGLEIESCSSGGARVDLEVLDRTDRIWVSDCIDPLERVSMHRWTTQLVPPELMGAHIASGRSHTTGRVHDLQFRAATAVFGHLGIEWDLAKASEAELADLAEWIAFYKEHRGLLLAGDLVRLDHPDPSLVGSGVVAPDRSAAVFSWATVSHSDVLTPGRLRFAGLDPEREYRVRPVMIGLSAEPHHGLSAPGWWNGGEGLRASGRLLTEAGLAAPVIVPDHTVLYVLD